MLRTVGVVTLALGTSIFSPVFAQEKSAADMKMTAAQCETLWTQALAGSTAGDLAMDKAQPYVKDFKKADKNTDSKLSQTEWMDACNQSAPAEPRDRVAIRRLARARAARGGAARCGAPPRPARH